MHMVAGWKQASWSSYTLSTSSTSCVVNDNHIPYTIICMVAGWKQASWSSYTLSTSSTSCAVNGDGADRKRPKRKRHRQP